MTLLINDVIIVVVGNAEGKPACIKNVSWSPQPSSGIIHFQPSRSQHLSGCFAEALSWNVVMESLLLLCSNLDSRFLATLLTLSDISVLNHKMRINSTSRTFTKKRTDHDCKLSRKVYFYIVMDKRLLIIFTIPVVFVSFNLYAEKQNKNLEVRMIWDTEQRGRKLDRQKYMMCPFLKQSLYHFGW